VSEPFGDRPAGTEAIRWQPPWVSGFKIGVILTGDQAGARCARPVSGPDVMLIRQGDEIVMRMPDGTGSPGLPVSAVRALMKRNARGKMTIGVQSVPFTVMAALAADRVTS
jgi:hypothetical protein